MYLYIYDAIQDFSPSMKHTMMSCGGFQTKGFNKVCQRGELDWALQLQPSVKRVIPAVMSKLESMLIIKD